MKQTIAVGSFCTAYTPQFINRKVIHMACNILQKNKLKPILTKHLNQYSLKKALARKLMLSFLW